ncbi:hypothetical protein [Hyphomicrobium sp.]|uniref:hypothetical protein n=1 Tax=Hyphomicrobium sp. TaxID=82 RepID=UPI003F6F1A27
MAFWTKLVTSISKDAGPVSTKERLTSDRFRRPQRLKEGFIWADSMILPRPCTIRDLSPLTAEVVLWNDDIKPAILRGELKLYSSADRKEADCIVASRDGNTLSLRIMTAFRPPTRNYA